ncbi:MAG: Ycf66 family protein [Chroococcales cyanobacterium]
MLAYILAIAVGLGSLVFYIAAFFFPEIHRKSDFIWSSIGLFYALVLWVCAGRITGGVLLGQMAGVALLGWFGWQTLTLRQALTPSEQKTEVSPEVQEQVKGFSIGKVLTPVTGLLRRRKPETEATPTAKSPVPSAEEAKQEIAESSAIEANPEVDITSDEPVNKAETEATPPNPAEPKDIEAAAPKDLSAKEGENIVVEEAAIESATPEVESPTVDEKTVEDVAPETEFTPPAEPLGDGSPSMRANPPEPPVAMEAVPVDKEEEEKKENQE